MILYKKSNKKDDLIIFLFLRDIDIDQTKRERDSFYIFYRDSNVS